MGKLSYRKKKNKGTKYKKTQSAEFLHPTNYNTNLNPLQ